MTMNVLVAYATRHGATAGIATRIAETLTTAGHQAVALPVDQVSDLDRSARPSTGRSTTVAAISGVRSRGLVPCRPS